MTSEVKTSRGFDSKNTGACNSNCAHLQPKYLYLKCYISTCHIIYIFLYFHMVCIFQHLQHPTKPYESSVTCHFNCNRLGMKGRLYKLPKAMGSQILFSTLDASSTQFSFTVMSHLRLQARHAVHQIMAGNGRQIIWKMYFLLSTGNLFALPCQFTGLCVLCLLLILNDEWGATMSGYALLVFGQVIRF